MIDRSNNPDLVKQTLFLFRLFQFFAAARFSFAQGLNHNESTSSEHDTLIKPGRLSYSRLMSTWLVISASSDQQCPSKGKANGTCGHHSLGVAQRTSSKSKWWKLFCIKKAGDPFKSNLSFSPRFQEQVKVSVTKLQTKLRCASHCRDGLDEQSPQKKSQQLPFLNKTVFVRIKSEKH